MRKFSIALPKEVPSSKEVALKEEAKFEDLDFPDSLTFDQLLRHENKEIQEDDGAGEVTLASIWKNVCIQEDIIIIIDKTEELRVRKLLSSLKAKENAKMRSAGLKPDDSTLEFIEHKDFNEKEKDKIKLQIVLRRKPTVRVHKMIIAKE